MRVKYETRPCVCCNTDHNIVDHNRWLCKECKEKRKKSRINKATLENENNDLQIVFNAIWECREHKCYHCGKFLGNEPKVIFFSHILSRGAHPKLRCVPENIVLACNECHYIYDFGDRSLLKRNIPEELIDNLLKIDKDGQR